MIPLPTSCGDWSAPAGTVGAAFAARYGEIRTCERYGTQFVITTLGDAQRHSTGVIAVYACAAEDAACLDGRKPHPVAGWEFFPPPYPGGVTVLIQSSPNVLIVDDAGYQMCFDLQSHAYDQNPGCQ
jgi:hypothetical protein